MSGRGTAPAKSGILEEQSAMPVEQLCGMDRCEERRVTAFRDENLCCNHFLGRCYEFLERIDPNRDLASNGGQRRAEVKKAIEECAQRALEVALGNPSLNNVQRAKLLDILLWTSDITIAAHAQKASNGDFLKRREAPSPAVTEKSEKKWDPQGSSLRTSLLW